MDTDRRVAHLNALRADVCYRFVLDAMSDDGEPKTTVAILVDRFLEDDKPTPADAAHLCAVLVDRLNRAVNVQADPWEGWNVWKPPHPPSFADIIGVLDATSRYLKDSRGSQ